MPVLRRMTQPEYDDWLGRAISAYAKDKVASGQWPAEKALALSAREHAELLPQGLKTPDHYHFAIVGDNAFPVGMLWFAVKTRFSAPVAYVFNIEVLPEHRLKGHARRALLALEEEIRKLGLSGIALHVFGHNLAARELYARLGYEPTNINLFKAVTHPGACPFVAESTPCGRN